MILAAGLGTRLQPLTELRAKPALPVRGLPIVAYLLHLLNRHGVSEVMINLHHHPESLREAVEEHLPTGMSAHFSHESQLLGTGGALRRVSDFLRESDPSLVLAGDMLLDLDLACLVGRHRKRGDQATLILRSGDPREGIFGTIGTDREGRVRRIGTRFDMGGESAKGVFVSVRLLAPRAFDAIPDQDAFEDLSDWFAPALAAGARDICGELLEPDECVWEPVGTPAEYLRVNLEPTPLSYLDAERLASEHGTRFSEALVVGADATLDPGARLDRAVVWDGEHVPGSLHARNGVFADGRFHPIGSSGVESS